MILNKYLKVMPWFKKTFGQRPHEENEMVPPKFSDLESFSLSPTLPPSTFKQYSEACYDQKNSEQHDCSTYNHEDEHEHEHEHEHKNEHVHENVHETGQKTTIASVRSFFRERMRHDTVLLKSLLYGKERTEQNTTNSTNVGVLCDLNLPSENHNSSGLNVQSSEPSNVPFTEKTPWWLAERVVDKLLEDCRTEAALMKLFDRSQTAMKQNNYLAHSLDIVDQTVDLMSYAFQDGNLKNAFHKNNALPTVYYVMVFLTGCSCYTSLSECDGHCPLDNAHRTAHCTLVELGILLMQVAKVVTKLLLNQEIYEFVNECLEHVEEVTSGCCVPSSLR